MKKLDDAEIYLLNFEHPDTPSSASTTHIGIFLAWALLRGLGSLSHVNFDFDRLRRREITGATFLDRYCGSKLVDQQDLNATGSAFAAWYYGRYLQDYLQVFGISADAPLDVLSEVKDDWASFDKVALVLDGRLREWLASVGLDESSIVAPLAAPEPPGQTAVLTFAAGDRVRHDRFGDGTVLTCVVERGMERALVAFESGEEKWLAVGVAKLERTG